MKGNTRFGMITVLATLSLLIGAPGAPLADGEIIVPEVLAGGGSAGSSATFGLSGTVGQIGSDVGSSEVFGLGSGFWEGAKDGEIGCCVGSRGNVNSDLQDNVNIADLTFLVSYLFGGGEPPECYEEANVNGDETETVNIADLTYLVAYLFGGGAAPTGCQ
jgi:hypothetical protein